MYVTVVHRCVVAYAKGCLLLVSRCQMFTYINCRALDFITKQEQERGGDTSRARVTRRTTEFTLSQIVTLIYSIWYLYILWFWHINTLRLVSCVELFFLKKDKRTEWHRKLHGSRDYANSSQKPTCRCSCFVECYTNSMHPVEEPS